MKKANLLIAASLIALGAQAEALSPAEALARVGSGAARRIAARSVNVQPELTVARHSEVPELYVFAPAEGGLLILSADSDAPALLGYSENFVAGEQLPPALEMMLEGYAEEIDAIRTGAEPGSASRSGSDDFKAISPICKTVWNQLAPYNEQTPVINGTQSPTGCEATAMAQVLKVYEYPAKCTGGTFTYQMSGQTMSINFDDVTLDWANMLNKYSGSKDPAVNRTAVATLMKALGYCAKTTYRASSSSAATSIMAAGVVKFFNYDDATIALDRNWFQPAQWEQMVYDELAAGYPVLYSGSNSSGGHAFVVDGYKGDGLYHVNWGWGGISDGYFLLTSLDPQQQGVGGSTAGYNISNCAIFKLRPGKVTPYSEVPLVFSGNGGFKPNVTRAKLGATTAFTYTNAAGDRDAIYSRGSIDAVQPHSAIKFVAEDGTEYFSHSANAQATVLPQNYGMYCGTIPIPANLPEGSYICYPMVWSGVTQKYSPVYYPIANAFTFEATVANGYITFGNAQAPSDADIRLAEITCTSPTTQNLEFSLKVVTAENGYEGQLYVEIQQEGHKGYIERFQSLPLKIGAKQSEIVVVGDEFKDGTIGQEYTARVYYWEGNDYVEVPGQKSCVFTLTDGSAIDEIKAGTAADAAVYDLSGRRVVKPAKGGIYISKNRKIKL